MSAADRSTYEQTGALPDAIKPTFTDDAPPASSAAPVVEPPAATVATPPPASEPGKPKGAEARAIELKAEIDALLTQRAALRREVAPSQTPPAASSPAPELPPEPDPSNYEKYPLGTSDPAYLKDMTAHAIAADRVAQHAESRKAADAVAARDAGIELGTRVKSFTAKYADFEAVTRGVTGIAPGSMLDAWILSSKGLGFEALYHFGKNPDVLASILAIRDPIEQIETVVLLGHSLKDATAAPPVKTKTDAPAIPPTLDTRPSAADNDAEAAMARGDAAAYQRIMNERDIAASGRRK